MVDPVHKKINSLKLVRSVSVRVCGETVTLVSVWTWGADMPQRQESRLKKYDTICVSDWEVVLKSVNEVQ